MRYIFKHFDHGEDSYGRYIGHRSFIRLIRHLTPKTWIKEY